MEYDLLISGHLMGEYSMVKEKFIQPHFTENSEMAPIFFSIFPERNQTYRIELCELSQRWKSSLISQ